MGSYKHDQIARAINALEVTPGTDQELSSWLRAVGHLNVLRQNAGDNEVILYASTRTTFIHAVITKESDVTPLDQMDLLKLDSSPFKGRAGYSWTLGSGTVQMEFSETNPLPRTMKHSQNLVFGRRMDGLDEPYRYELLQEFEHAAGIIWREDQRAYCRIDENGDFEPVVSITKSDDRAKATLITCQREPLEQYMAATGSTLVRFFDFTMIPQNAFHSWDGGVRERKIESNHLFYNQCIHPDGYAWTRGTQILPVTTRREDLFRSIIEFPFQRTGRQYATFVINDWRNGKVHEVSTDPAHSANYFNDENNSLPYETSPAFFRAEVLSKYKADRDKYTINEEHGFISCRGAWHLKSYSVNEDGQVHAYLCDLRNLPYQEQLYWKSNNEEPRGGISKRAYENDFEGVWASEDTPLERILYMLRQWNEWNVTWWQIKDEAILAKINTPVSSSRDEWAQSFLDLSIAVIENFRTKPIRGILSQKNIAFEETDRTLTLLERLLRPGDSGDGHRTVLEGLRQAQSIRSKVQSHSRGTEADEIARNALVEHGTYREHFKHVCDQIADELEMIEEACKAAQGIG